MTSALPDHGAYSLTGFQPQTELFCYPVGVRTPNGQKKKSVSLEENIQKLRDSLDVTSAQVLRHETRIKEHQKWLEDNELAYQKHRIMMAEHDAKMIELDDKITKIAAAQLVNEELSKNNAELLKQFLQRGGNGQH